MPRLLMVSSEAAPFAKTGGLADVLGALPPALVPLGWEPAVVLPRYRGMSLDGTRLVWDHLFFTLGQYDVHCSIHERMERGVRFFFIECPWLYDRPGIYGTPAGGSFPDNHIRFGALCHAAIEVARHLFRTPLFHLHDWQAALTAPFLRTQFHRDPIFQNTRIVFTIHNLEHQGRFHRPAFQDLNLDPWLFSPAFLEFFGDLNLMKGGILFSDAITTVSPTYAQEIQTPEFGFGLDGLLRAHSHRLQGLLNGADYSEWSPETDPFTAAPFSHDNLGGKRACKRDLLDEFGLPEDRIDKPLLGIVSRMAPQKGFHLLAEIADDLLQEDISLVVLGAGDALYEKFFRGLLVRFPGRAAVHIGYSNKLAHKIEAGSDIFLMPSIFEPCGLNQIYSLRYGTIPVVRATGGLDDTVDASTGFKFSGANPWDFYGAIQAAIAEYHKPERWKARMRTAMTRDFSWAQSAKAYNDLYHRLLSSVTARKTEFSPASSLADASVHRGPGRPFAD
ncbi:MAG: glycogen synthase GlgA, partial [Acidobacteriia bacterium]|nr:glycogen synthase GlgA [Terriglobia bacterium]